MGDDVEFLFIYTREAHAIDSDRPVAIAKIEQPLTTKERRKVALDFVEEAELPFSTLLDNIDDEVSKAYASLPDRMYLIGRDGKIAYAGQRGPRGFRPNELEAAIEQELKQAKRQTSEKATISPTLVAD